MTKEEYYLIHIMEECSEIIKECSKALRFGLFNFNPNDPTKTNHYRIIDEIDDLFALLDDMEANGHISLMAIDYERWEEKKTRMYEKLKLSKKAGTLIGENDNG